MKKALLALLSIIIIHSFGQSYDTKKATDSNGFSYEFVEGDPLKTRLYTLENGLQVYLSDYKATPKVHTFIAVRAGSKNDPIDHTGLAHYLEHIMFKGTSSFGTLDWEKEKVLLEEIEGLYEVYGTKTDTSERAKIYAQIDSVSYEAAKLAIANEYDKLVSNIGASGTNAYTWVEQTVYVNNIPSNEISKWIQIEANRFQEVVPRLFHTELEAVYEEKNRTLDNDGRKSWAALMKLLFPTHQYGTQTTIGTIEHLKSPSITAIKEYFDTYYIPNNIAICMSGDLDLDATIAAINKHFGSWERQPEPPTYTAPVESPITTLRDTTVYGPDAEGVSMAFRFPGQSTRESLMMEFISMILSNSQAGLIDLNLNQAQKVQGAYSYPLRMKDYSMHMLAAKPKEGQSLEEVKDLLLSQLEIIKQGEFEDWLLPAIINDYKLSQTIELESNKSRADLFVDAFIYDRKLADILAETDELESISKQDIIDFAKKYYNENYVVVYKKTGKDPVLKVPKPPITPVTVNRDDHSDFYQEVNALQSQQISPVYLDFEKDIVKGSVKGSLPIHYNQNTENDLFELFYIYDMGSLHDKKMALATGYLNYIGSKKYFASQLQQEFYKIGCTFNVHTASDQLYISISGLQKNIRSAVELIEDFLANPQADTSAYQAYVARILKSRNDAKLNKRSILSSALMNYAKYGENSAFLDKLSAEELANIKPEELTELVQGLYAYEHRVLYYGPSELTDVEKLLTKCHKFSKKPTPLPEKKTFEELPITKNKVLFVEYDMVQSEIILLSKSKTYDPDLIPQTQLFNEYYGGNMGSIVFQEMRESKALAYSVRSYYKTSSRADQSNYIISYIGTQADKTHDALAGMQELLHELPMSETTFENARNSLQTSLETSRTIKSGILFAYERANRLGLKEDLKKKSYEFVKNATLQDVESFFNTYYKDQPYTMLVIGSKDRLNIEELSQYGEVQELTLEQIFGY